MTVGALIAMAAHLEGKSASVLDFTGFAQKGRLGAELRALGRCARAPEPGAHRHPAGRRAARLRPGGGRLARGAAERAPRPHAHPGNLHEVPVAESLRNPDASLRVDALLEKLHFAAGRERVQTFDAQTLAEDFLSTPSSPTSSRSAAPGSSAWCRWACRRCSAPSS